MKLPLIISLVLLLSSSEVLHAQLIEKKVLSLEAAEKVAAAAALEAKKRNATVVIVVVDDGGYPLVLKRLDDTQVASVEVGIGKARTAAISGGRAEISRSKSKTAGSPRWFCLAQRLCRAACP